MSFDIALTNVQTFLQKVALGLTARPMDDVDHTPIILTTAPTKNFREPPLASQCDGARPLFASRRYSSAHTAGPARQSASAHPSAPV